MNWKVGGPPVGFSLTAGMPLRGLHDIQLLSPALFYHFRRIVVPALLIDPPFVGDFFTMIEAAPVSIVNPGGSRHEKDQRDQNDMFQGFHACSITREPPALRASALTVRRGMYYYPGSAGLDSAGSFRV